MNVDYVWHTTNTSVITDTATVSDQSEHICGGPDWPPNLMGPGQTSKGDKVESGAEFQFCQTG